MVEQRDKALYELYKKIWRENPSLSYGEVIDRVLESPQPRTWIPFWGVYRLLRRIARNENVPPKRLSRTGQDMEVWEKYLKLKKQPLFRDCSIYFLSAFIIAEPSIGFYISKVHAKRIIWKTRRALNRKYKNEKD